MTCSTQTMTAFAVACAAAISTPTTAQERADLPQVSLGQKTSLRCAAAFALVADAQERGDETALGWPPMAERGREYMVRVSAQIMDDARLDRTQVARLLRQEAHALRDQAQTNAIMPSCLMLLAASGI